MMKGFTQGKSFDLRFVTDFYPWEKHSNGTFVDVSQTSKCMSKHLS